MAVEKQFCANPECLKHTVHTGGRFIFNAESKKTYCDDCYKIRAVMNSGKNLFEFTTTHFNGQPVHVTGIGHLREMERKYGVSSCVLNMEQANWDKRS